MFVLLSSLSVSTCRGDNAAEGAAGVQRGGTVRNGACNKVGWWSGRGGAIHHPPGHPEEVQLWLRRTRRFASCLIEIYFTTEETCQAKDCIIINYYLKNFIFWYDKIKVLSKKIAFQNYASFSLVFLSVSFWFLFHFVSYFLYGRMIN